MSSADDKVEGGKTGRRKTVDKPTPQSEANQRWINQEKQFRKENNAVTDTWYELSQGHKLVLCKRRGRGSVYRTLIGSTKAYDKSAEAKAHAASVTAKVQQLQNKKELRVRG